MEGYRVTIERRIDGEEVFTRVFDADATIELIVRMSNGLYGEEPASKEPPEPPEPMEPVEPKKRGRYSKKRVITCKNCGGIGHTKKTCSMESAEQEPEMAVSEPVYDAVKETFKEVGSSTETAEHHDLPLAVVNEIIKAPTYDHYIDNK